MSQSLQIIYRQTVNMGFQTMGHEVTPGDTSLSYEQFEVDIKALFTELVNTCKDEDDLLKKIAEL